MVVIVVNANVDNVEWRQGDPWNLGLIWRNPPAHCSADASAAGSDAVPYVVSQELRSIPGVQLYSWVAVNNWSGYYSKAAVSVPSHNLELSNLQVCPSHSRFKLASRALTMFRFAHPIAVSSWRQGP